MARNVLHRNGVPAAMFDGDASLLAHSFEANLDFGVLLARECRLAPAEDEPASRLPCAHFANLENLAVRQLLDKTTARAALETHNARTAWREVEQAVRLPPTADFLGKHIERALRCRRHPQSYEDARAGHRRRFDFSMCALNERSC